jgi:hypothetical protein
MMDHAPRGLATARNRANTRRPGKFGNESIGTLIATARSIVGRKVRTISPTQDRQPKSEHTPGCVAKQRDHRAWFARTKLRSAEFHLR